MCVCLLVCVLVSASVSVFMCERVLVSMCVHAFPCVHVLCVGVCVFMFVYACVNICVCVILHVCLRLCVKTSEFTRAMCSAPSSLIYFYLPSIAGETSKLFNQFGEQT